MSSGKPFAVPDPDLDAPDGAVPVAPDLPRPWLIGELNPYGGDPKYALYPYPENSAGHRLCTKVLGLTRRAYLHSYQRINLCVGSWSIVRARQATFDVLVEHAQRDSAAPLVLLGAKVSGAFGVDYVPLSIGIIPDSLSTKYIVLPHPSGRCLYWNDPQSLERVRAALREAGALR